MPITNIRFAVLAHANVQSDTFDLTCWYQLCIYIQITARYIDSKPKIGGAPASADISRLSMCQSIAQQGWKGQTKSHGSVQTSFKITNCKKEQFENLVQLLLWTPSLLSEPIMVLVDPFLRQACANLQYGIVVKTEPANLLQSIFVRKQNLQIG